MENQSAKRILILSNECLSTRTSNGRTLSNFFIGYPKECLAQFSLQHVAPDFERCERYFCVSDNEALQAFIKGKRVGEQLVRKAEEDAISSVTAKGPGRTALTMLLRNLVWNSGRWKKGGFAEFVKEFSPEVILLQAGDCAFMFRIAQKLAKQYQIPLVIYNSEGYFFKKHDYFLGKGVAHWCYPIFRRHFCKAFRRIMKRADYVIYNCPALQQDYAKYFDTPSEVLYTATQLQPPAQKKTNDPLRISYLGTLEVGRPQSLIKLANILGEFGAALDVYGRFPNEQTEKELRACPHIRIGGFVSYEEVVNVMQSSDILVHAEGFDDFYREDSKYAFSTKIADTLACGTCFLVYAAKEFACSRYLTENRAAWVVCDENELRQTVKRLMEEPECRNDYFENAQKLVAKNHQVERNAARFTEILNNVQRGARA